MKKISIQTLTIAIFVLILGSVSAFSQICQGPGGISGAIDNILFEDPVFNEHSAVIIPVYGSMDTLIYEFSGFSTKYRDSMPPDPNVVMRAIVGAFIRTVGATCDNYKYILRIPTCLNANFLPNMNNEYENCDDCTYSYPFLFDISISDPTVPFDEFYFIPQYQNGQVILLDYSFNRSPCMGQGMSVTMLLNTFAKGIPDPLINPINSYATQRALYYLLIRTNSSETFSDGENSIRYEPMFSVCADSAGVHNVRLPIITGDMSTFAAIDKRKWFAEITKNRLEALGREMTPGQMTFEFRYPDMDFDSSSVSYGDPVMNDKIIVTLERGVDYVKIADAQLLGPQLTECSPNPDMFPSGELLLTNVLEANYNTNISNPQWDVPARRLITENLVGSIQGNYSVSESGTFSYSIPIDVMPGTANMTPSVSLNYSSNSGAGLLGHGWNLSAGVSCISRSGYTQKYDGLNHYVSYDNHDKLFLDGTELIFSYKTVNDGRDYGDMGSVYVPKNGSDNYTVTMYRDNLHEIFTKPFT